MARPKKPQYEWYEPRKCYRKRVKDADGKYFSLYAKTPEEMTLKIKEVEMQIEEAVYRKNHPTLSQYADRWLAMHQPLVRPGTFNDYRYIINSFIKEPLGHRYISEITQDDIKLALIPVSSKSESVHRKTVMLYKQIFESAEDSGIISRSPCRKLGKGGVPQKKKHALTNQQAQILLDTISSARTDIVPFVMVGLYAGMRREEILGLKWSNVTLDGNAPHISVRTAVRWISNQPVVTDELKSAAAYRDIPIPPNLVACLAEHKKKSASEFVFAGKDGKPKTETQFQSMWEPVTTRMVKPHTYTKYNKDGSKEIRTVTPQKGEKAYHRNYCYNIDFDVTPHILRHTYITNLLLAGVDVKTVQYLAGHENAKITLDIYAHLTYNKPEDIIHKVTMAFEATSAATNDTK